MSFEIKFWGVRGSIACPGPDHIVYGGNTSCIEVKAGDRRIVLDAGTGIRGLGRSFLKDDIGHAEILLTHTHWDHINGFPFFAPAFQKARSFRIMAGHLKEEGGIRKVLAAQMSNPTFPVPLNVMKSSMTFEDFEAGNSFELAPDIRIKTAPLNHPGHATGYRIEHAGKAFCYVTDTEHVPGKPNQNILGLVEGADFMIYDSMYTDDEFPDKVGWGHSTWQEGIRLARAAGVKKLILSHHDPDHEDPVMERIAAEARKSWSSAVVAREGMRISLV